MLAKLAFVDTETTGLDLERHELWEVAIITADPYGDGSGYHFDEWVTQLPVNLATADPMALSISGWYERSEQWNEKTTTFNVNKERDVAREIIDRTRGRHLVGAVPSFDSIRIEALVRAYGFVPTWHFHLIDVEHLVAGYLACEARNNPNEEGIQIELARPPWKSDELAAAVGVTIAPEDRHTALGDARWARDIYFAVMGGR